MSVADILRECGIVPTVPTASPRVGTLQTLAGSHVPAVPIVPIKKHKARAPAPKPAPASRGDHDRMRAALLALADGLGLDRAIAHRLTVADLADCAGFPSDALRVYLLALDDTATRQAGRVPLDDTAAIHCERCGPVYVHPGIAAVLPVVNGCPWCFIRKAGGYIPRPRVACDTCARFQTDTLNPVAGMGICASGHGMHYPMQQHGCGDYRPKGADHD